MGKAKQRRLSRFLIVAAIIGAAIYSVHGIFSPTGVNHVVLINYSGKAIGPILVKSETKGGHGEAGTVAVVRGAGLRADDGSCCVVNFDYPFYGDAHYSVVEEGGSVLYSGDWPQEGYGTGRYGHVLVIEIGASDDLGRAAWNRLPVREINAESKRERKVQRGQGHRTAGLFSR